MPGGLTVDVRSNIERVAADFRAQSAQINTATYRALNRAQDKGATETSREIRKVYNLRDRTVKAALRKYRASKNRLFATMEIQGARIGLIEFEARWRQGQKGGATVKIKVAGGRRIVAGAFIASGQGGAAVFRRVGKRRFPIRALRSISIPQAFDNDAVVSAVQRLAVAAFEQNFEQQLRFLSRGSNG